MTRYCAPQAGRRVQADPDPRFGGGPAGADQVVADVRQSQVLRRVLPARFHGECERRLGHRILAGFAVARDALDGVAVGVAGGEVHPGIHAGRVGAQRAFHAGEGLDELAPVGGGEQAQAADAVAHGHLFGGLVLRLELHELLGAAVVLGQPLLQPAQGQGQRRGVAVQPAHQFRHERRRHGRLGTRHVGHHQDQSLRVALGHLEHAVRPLCGQAAVGAAGGHLHRDATQVLDQRQPQHDREGPELAEQQRTHRLVGRDEAGQRSELEPAVAVRHGLHRQVIDPRQTRARPGAQARQLAAVARGQEPCSTARLLLQQVVVVDQPLAGGCAPALRPLPLAEQLAYRRQGPTVVGQACQQPVGRAREFPLVRPGQ